MVSQAKFPRAKLIAPAVGAACGAVLVLVIDPDSWAPWILVPVLAVIASSVARMLSSLLNQPQNDGGGWHQAGIPVERRDVQLVPSEINDSCPPTWLVRMDGGETIELRRSRESLRDRNGNLDFSSDIATSFDIEKQELWRDIHRRWIVSNLDAASIIQRAQRLAYQLHSAGTNTDLDASRWAVDEVLKIWNRGWNGSENPLHQDLQAVMDSHTLSSLNEQINRKVFDLRWIMPMNAALGAVEKAKKLKTQNARRRHAQGARVLLNKAKQFPGCEPSKFSFVEGAIDDLEKM